MKLSSELKWSASTATWYSKCYEVLQSLGVSLMSFFVGLFVCVCGDVCLIGSYRLPVSWDGIHYPWLSSSDNLYCSIKEQHEGVSSWFHMGTGLHRSSMASLHQLRQRTERCSVIL